MAQYNKNQSFLFSKFSEVETKENVLMYLFNHLLDNTEETFKQEHEILLADLYKNINSQISANKKLKRKLKQEKLIIKLLKNKLCQ